MKYLKGKRKVKESVSSKFFCFNLLEIEGSFKEAVRLSILNLRCDFLVLILSFSKLSLHTWASCVRKWGFYQTENSCISSCLRRRLWWKREPLQMFHHHCIGRLFSKICDFWRGPIGTEERNFHDCSFAIRCEINLVLSFSVRNFLMKTIGI